MEDHGARAVSGVEWGTLIGADEWDEASIYFSVDSEIAVQRPNLGVFELLSHGYQAQISKRGG